MLCDYVTHRSYRSYDAARLGKSVPLLPTREEHETGTPISTFAEIRLHHLGGAGRALMAPQL